MVWVLFLFGTFFARGRNLLLLGRCGVSRQGWVSNTFFSYLSHPMNEGLGSEFGMAHIGCI